MQFFGIPESQKCWLLRGPKPRNINFAKVEKRGGLNRVGAFITKNTVFNNLMLGMYQLSLLFVH